MSANLYEVLGIAQHATAAEIKKAFYKKLQQIGGPEKNPDEYKKIREAYDTLHNEVSRTEYDTMLGHGDEINTLDEQVKELMNAEEPPYDEIIKLLKRAIALGPKIGRLRYLLGQAYLETEKPAGAIEQFKKALEVDDENPGYWLNLGRAYRDHKNNDQAEKCFKKAIDLEPDDNASYIALGYLYFNNKRRALAYETIDQAIMSDGVIDFSDFMLLYHKIQMLLLDGKAEQTKAVFEQIYQVAKSKEDKIYAGWMFFKFAHDLLEYRAYELMYYLTESAVQLDPDEPNYKDFHEFVETNVKAWEEFDALQKRELHPVLVEYVRAYVANYGGHIDEDEYNSRLEDLREALMFVFFTYPERGKFLRDLRTMKTDYPRCFDFNPTFFNDLLSKKNIGYTKYSAKCPHCGDKVNAGYGDYAIYSCPHCGNSINYTASGYSKYGSSGGGDCFVATAIYRNPEHPNLVTLRLWRDHELQRIFLGRLFVRAYYRCGPYLANLCTRFDIIEKICSFSIDRLIPKLRKRVDVHRGADALPRKRTTH